MGIEVCHYAAGDMDVLHRKGDRLAPMHSVLMQPGSFIRTFRVNGEVAAVFGLVVRWPGVGDVWAVVGDNARGYGRPLTRTAKALFHTFADDLGLWRLGAMVRADAVEYQRWIELLGFEYEGTEIQAGPTGQDIHRYRWLRWPSLTAAPRLQ